MNGQRDAFLGGEADAWFARNRTPRPGTPDRVDRLRRYVPANASVLEIGCADGRRLAEIADLAGRCVGIDPSVTAITEGRARWPQLELYVGSADALPFDRPFDVVILGFFLYLADRELLPRIVAEADRSLADGGTLIIVDFDPRYPRRRQYRHRAGIWSFKMDYASLFLAFPAYSLVEKVPFTEDGDSWTADETERVAMTVLHKDLAAGYSLEVDRS